jgi:hypothetical protein
MRHDPDAPLPGQLLRAAALARYKGPSAVKRQTPFRSAKTPLLLTVSREVPFRLPPRISPMGRGSDEPLNPLRKETR